MKEFFPKLFITLWVVAFGVAIFWRSMSFEPFASCMFLTATSLIGVLLGWSLHAWKGGK
nr:MAG TPA: hypothetical protein [Caudoviricetes sp.]